MLAVCGRVAHAFSGRGTPFSCFPSWASKNEEGSTKFRGSQFATITASRCPRRYGMVICSITAPVAGMRGTIDNGAQRFEKHRERADDKGAAPDLHPAKKGKASTLAPLMDLAENEPIFCVTLVLALGRLGARG